MKLLKIAAWNGAGLCLVLLLAEAIFGKWFWGDHLSDINIFRDIEWLYSAQGHYGRSDPVIYRRDKWGFRGGFTSPDEIDILVVGGSTTDERFVTEGETWTDRFEQCLRAAGRDLTVANAGVTGQSTHGHVRNFDLWFSKVDGLKPSYVLAYVGINDTWATGDKAAFKDDVRRFNEQEDTLSPWSVWFQGVKMKSALYRVYRTVLGQWTAFRAGVTIGPEVASGQSAAERFAASSALAFAKTTDLDSPAAAELLAIATIHRKSTLDFFRKNLGELVRRIRDIGATPVLATQRWANYRRRGNVIGGDVWRYIFQQELNNVALGICRVEDVVCIDVGSEVEFASGDTFDVIHTTPKGSKKVGEYICRQWLAAPTLAAGKSAKP